jgi:hypothetical protein
VVLAGGEVLHGEVVDLCRDAALVALPRSLDLESLVLLSVSLPGFLGAFEAAGRVVRIGGPVEGGVGVVVLFGDLSPNTVTAIDLYLERLARESGAGPSQGGAESA